MKKPILLLCCLLGIIPLSVFSQQSSLYPKEVEVVLKKAGKNRVELEKTIRHFKQSGDAQKLKATYFLIANMDIHQSVDYYWADKAGNKVPYNELAYPDFGKAVQAFNVLKKQHPGISPKPIVYKDEEHISSNFLISNIEKAFRVWRVSTYKNIPFDAFCEYVLPYRVSVEPLQEWRSTYTGKFAWLDKQIKDKGLQNALLYVADDYNNWFTINTVRKEPLPRLGAMQLLLRKQGPCEDIAGLEVFSMRSRGIPSSVNIIPYWATSTGSHFVNTVFDTKMRTVQFDVANANPVNRRLPREPSKVLRLTYSKQAATLAGFEKTANIPEGFLRTQNYIDITDEYWETGNITCALFPSPEKPKVAYVSVFNGLRWCPTWWAKIKDGQANFSKICKGAVFLPQYYINGKLTPAGYPVIAGYTYTRVLIPNLHQRSTVAIHEAENYLAFKPGILYRLLYWDGKWKLADQKTATSGTRALSFAQVPKNALLLLLSSDSKRTERPFIINSNGQREWF
jgi:hypothetical protein